MKYLGVRFLRLRSAWYVLLLKYDDKTGKNKR